jgi:protein SCO1/2
MALCLLTRIHAAEPLPRELTGVRVDEKLGQTIPLNLEFTDENQQKRPLSDYFGKGRPVVVQLVYYSCPMLCTLVLNGFTAGAKQLDWTPGEQYDIVTISINPKEAPALANIKKQNYLKDYGRPQAAEGWHWLVSPDNAVKQLADAIGFHYEFDERQQQFAHEAAIFVLTSDGKLSRYLYGIQFKPKDLRLALLEAGEGKVGTTFERFMMFCYHYDPVGKKYALVAMRVMQVGGGITVVFLGSIVGFYVWSERRRARRQAQPVTPESVAAPPTATGGPAAV